MAERPPSRPRVAWQEEVGAPQELRPPLDPKHVDVVQPLQIDAGWLPVYQFERRRVDSIVSFVSSPEKEESQKIPFLQNICDLCYNSKRHGPPQGLDLFCQRYGLAENIKVLLEEEPRNKLRTAVRWNAMRAIAELSAVERALEGKEASLLQACFSSVFLLPPEEKMQDMGRYLFLKTMEAMDNMLQALVLGSSASRVSELLQNIFQMLLTFTTSERECVQERAVGRIEKMSSALFRHPTLASCARYLRTSERTDIVLVFIEVMRDSSIYDKKRATDLLDMVMEFPDFWLADLPKIMRCIHKNLDGINTAPARQSVASLLLLMADRRPGKVLTTLLRIAPPGDRTALDMWDMMISTPRPLKKILKNLRKRLLVIDSMFPEGVISGSESPDMARKIQSLLPQVVGLLDHSNTEVKRRVLTFFCSVMGHLKSEEARPTVEQLEEKLLPLFDDESSQLRELSICLFRERVQSVMAHDKKRIKSYVHRALLPLFFRLSDQNNNVAKLEQDRSRAQELLSQSLPYLRDAQASLREAAVRFIGLLTAPCGCCFDPRVFRIQWTVPYNYQGTVVAAATPVLPTPIPSGYQSLEEKFARLSISSKATAAGTPPGSHVHPSCSAAPNNKAAGDPTSHLVVPKKTNLQDAQGKKHLSSVPKPEEQGRKRRHEQGHSPEPPSKRSTAMELPQPQAAPAEQRGRKRSHERGHSPEPEPPSKCRAGVAGGD
ncbi:hypothetical protein Q9966_016261 [Columba livia]|nr:hypothetical protein Q9966_016261 [Columba livia]